MAPAERPATAEASAEPDVSYGPAGTEQVVDAFECQPDLLRNQQRMASLFAAIINGLDLHPVLPPVWHAFPAPGGLTGIAILAESHLACHTFPERGFATFNLYCCRPRPPLAWAACLREWLGARSVSVRVLPRGQRVAAPIA
jgi:S-adenosylmethionine decarboxylase